MKRIVLFILLTAITSIFAQDKFTEKFDESEKLFHEKKYEESKEILEEILEEDNNNARVHYHLAIAYLINDDLDKGIEFAERAVELEPNNADYHFRLGQLYGEDAKQASIFRKPFLAGKVKEQFEKTVELDPKHKDGHHGLARFHMMAPGVMGGDIEEAIKSGKVVKELDEIEGGFLLYEIYNEKEDFKNSENELIELEKKIGNDHEHYYLYNYYGYFLLGQTRIDDAITMFKKQVELAPDKANPYDSLGEAFWKKGELKEALANYKKALELNPNSEKAEEAIEELEEELGI